MKLTWPLPINTHSYPSTTSTTTEGSPLSLMVWPHFSLSLLLCGFFPFCEYMGFLAAIHTFYHLVQVLNEAKPQVYSNKCSKMCFTFKCIAYSYAFLCIILATNGFLGRLQVFCAYGVMYRFGDDSRDDKAYMSIKEQ